MALRPSKLFSVIEILEVRCGSSRFMMFLDDEAWYFVIGKRLESEEGGGFTMFLAAEGW